MEEKKTYITPLIEIFEMPSYPIICLSYTNQEEADDSDVL